MPWACTTNGTGSLVCVDDVTGQKQTNYSVMYKGHTVGSDSVKFSQVDWQSITKQETQHLVMSLGSKLAAVIAQ